MKVCFLDTFYHDCFVFLWNLEFEIRFNSQLLEELSEKLESFLGYLNGDFSHDIDR